MVNEKEVKPDIAKVVREQLNRSAYKHALRSRYKPISDEPMSDELLKRLAEQEAKKDSEK